MVLILKGSTPTKLVSVWRERGGGGDLRGTLGEHARSPATANMISLLFAVEAVGPSAGRLISGPNAAAPRGLRSERSHELW